MKIMEYIDNPKIPNVITSLSFLLEIIDFIVLHWGPILSISIVIILAITIFIQTSKREKERLKNSSLEATNTQLLTQVLQLKTECARIEQINKDFLSLKNTNTELLNQIKQLKNNCDELDKVNKKISEIRMEHWDLLTTKTRNVVIKNSFSIFDALTFCVEKIKDILPQERSKYQITIVRPLCNENFELLWSLEKDNLLNSSILTWKKEEEENEGFFSKGLREIGMNIPYEVYCRNNISYSDIPRKQKYAKKSEYHFMIPLKDKKYPAGFPQKCIGLISIGIPQEYDFSEHDYELFYSKMYPYIANIELFIQTYILFKNKVDILCRGFVDVP